MPIGTTRRAGTHRRQPRSRRRRRRRGRRRRPQTMSFGCSGKTRRAVSPVLRSGGAMDEAAAVIERRTGEHQGRLELGPLSGEQDLVDQHLTNPFGGSGAAGEQRATRRRSGRAPSREVRSRPRRLSCRRTWAALSLSSYGGTPGNALGATPPIERDQAVGVGPSPGCGPSVRAPSCRALSGCPRSLRSGCSRGR